ncbi:MAG TPA: hypothetical protein VGH27_17540 [Streptosporangiaceae bacterium]|jgi:hypothetical protein
MNIGRFSIVLADRLSAIVPAGIHVTADNGILRYSEDNKSGRAGTYISANFGVYGESDEEDLVGVAVQALDELQDYVSEATCTPWPGVHSQPSPNGQIRGVQLELWYVENGKVVLACSPIPLADLDEGHS